MTRQEYKIEALKFVGQEYLDRVNFPMLLKEMAICCFLVGEDKTPFAKETRRRITQLKNLGWTDD